MLPSDMPSPIIELQNDIPIPSLESSSQPINAESIPLEVFSASQPVDNSVSQKIEESNSKKEDNIEDQPSESYNKDEDWDKEEDAKSNDKDVIEIKPEEFKESKSESEYEDVEDLEFDIFNSDDSTERKRIIPVKYAKNILGYIPKSNISKKITVFVKTFFGERIKEKFEVDINSEVGTLIRKHIIILTYF